MLYLGTIDQRTHGFLPLQVSEGVPPFSPNHRIMNKRKFGKLLHSRQQWLRKYINSVLDRPRESW